MYTIRMTFSSGKGYVIRDIVCSACPADSTLRGAYQKGAVHVQIAKGNGSFRRISPR